MSILCLIILHLCLALPFINDLDYLLLACVRLVEVFKTCRQSGLEAQPPERGHVASTKGTPGQGRSCTRTTYSLRRICAIKLLQNVRLPPGSTQQKHLQECAESQI